VPKKLDIRETPHFPDGDALHIPLSELDQRISEVANSDKILIVGEDPRQTKQAMSILWGAGFHNAEEMAEGLLAYKGEFLLSDQYHVPDDIE